MAEIWAHVDIWKALAGLGIFLFGMRFMEEALQSLAGASFKRFLRKQTSNGFKAILAGATVTAILQSSSVVTLMVLAFVGAGTLQLGNAVGVIVGANLGTTFTGWIVAFLGFKLSIESFSLPMIAIGGISLAFLSGSKAKDIGRFFIGFGFLFLGLDYMKVSIEAAAQFVDLGQVTAHGTYLFFLVGFVLTAIIQSSSASMVINLSALSAGIIPIEAAILMVIGSDLGTTVTGLLGSIGGSTSTKQAAASHFLFNLVTACIGLALLKVIVYFITQVIQIADPLLILVSFHSLFNLIGIILFFPFLKPFARLLQRMFKDQSDSAAKHIYKVTTEVPEAAIEALRQEIAGLIQHIFGFALQVFNLPTNLYNMPRAGTEGPLAKDGKDLPQYQAIKQLEGEIVAYYLKIQNERLETSDTELLEKYIFAVRNAMQAVKGIKDIQHNVIAINRSANDEQAALLSLMRAQLSNFYLDLYRVLTAATDAGQLEQLAALGKQNQEIYQKIMDEIYRLTKAGRLLQLDTSTFLNMNREIYSANRALVMAVKDLRLSPNDAKAYTQLQD